MSISPEWVIAGLALCGMLYHIGYTSRDLSWLKENAATKADLEIIRMSQGVKDDSVSHTEHEIIRINQEIASMRINLASVIAEVRAIQK